MCISRLPDGAAGDDEAVRIANDCDFALSSCAHSGSSRRAAAICARLEAGMSAVNDLEGTTYLSQSLPFGGMKCSVSGPPHIWQTWCRHVPVGAQGFDRFAGVEGLRGLCHAKSIVTDRLFSLSIPAQIAYPSTGQGAAFGSSLVQIVYGYSVLERLRGVVGIVRVSLFGAGQEGTSGGGAATVSKPKRRASRSPSSEPRKRQ